MEGRQNRTSLTERHGELSAISYYLEPLQLTSLEENREVFEEQLSSSATEAPKVVHNVPPFSPSPTTMRNESLLTTPRGTPDNTTTEDRKHQDVLYSTPMLPQHANYDAVPDNLNCTPLHRPKDEETDLNNLSSHPAVLPHDGPDVLPDNLDASDASVVVTHIVSPHPGPSQKTREPSNCESSKVRLVTMKSKQKRGRRKKVENPVGPVKRTSLDLWLSKKDLSSETHELPGPVLDADVVCAADEGVVPSSSPAPKLRRRLPRVVLSPCT